MYKPHEARIHESVFDTLSRPLLSRSSGENGDRDSRGSSPRHAGEGRFSSHRSASSAAGTPATPHVTWSHFGHKFHIHLSQTDFAGDQDLFELLYHKVRALVPDFRGHLAFKDAFDHEVILNNDGQLRQLFAQSGPKNRVRLFTTLSGTSPSHLASSEMGSNRGSQIGDRRAQSQPNLLQKACEEVRGGDRPNAEPKGTTKKLDHLQSLPTGSGQLMAIPPAKVQASGLTYMPVSMCWPLPVFIRGSWIGPNKFWGGGSWGGGGGLFGGIGPIPSGRYWHTAAGGRPPW